MVNDFIKNNDSMIYVISDYYFKIKLNIKTIIPNKST